MKWLSKKYLWILITIVLFSMLGLIAFQVYWITFSYDMKEKQFNYQVKKALSETIRTIETNETIFEISNEVFQLAENEDSVVNRSIRNFDQSKDKYKNDIHTLANRSSVTMNGSQVLKSDSSTNLMSLNQVTEKPKEAEAFLNISTGDVKSIIQNKVDNKTLFVEKIVNQILNYNEDILQRLSKNDLNTLIDKSLKEHDIDIHFEYAIKSNGEWKFETENFRKKSTRTFSKKLFPNNLFNDNDYLEIYIPGRVSFIIRSMIPILLITILLTFLIIGVVVFTFVIILRQKKLGDVKNDFVNNLTHELKTPIATISLAGQMLSDKDIQATQSSIKRYAEIINQEASRLTTQVEKVLQIALIDKGELKLKNVRINLNQLTEKVCKPFIMKIESFNGQLKVNLPKNPVWIYADELHISNIISNLIDNALKYKLDTPVIEVSVVESENGIKLIVKDNGIGMSKVDQLRIFEKFYRVEGGNIHNIKGFGLGLSYVKKIIDLYKGKIEVRSKLKQGSTFTMTLPKPNFSQQI